MLERLTERARQVMALANQQAQRLHHAYIGPEHILLGIVQEGRGIAASALKSLGLKLDQVLAEVEQLAVSGSDTANLGKLPQSPQTRRVVEHAIEEARSQHQNYVGTEHLLIGLLQEPDSPAARALGNLNITLAAARTEIDHLLAPEAAEPDDSSGQLIRRAVECLLRARDAAVREGNQTRATELQNQAWTIGGLLTRHPDQPGQ